MNTIELLLQRFQNQQLLQPAMSDPQQLVAWMGATQAQDYALSKWALGLRLKDITDNDIEKAIATGSIIRTHILRPTWHLVAPADIRWMLQLTAPRIQAFAAPYYKQHGLDKPVFKRSHKLLEKLLGGRKHMSRPDIGKAFTQAKISEQGQRLNHILIHAELEGLICSGPRVGKQISYALLDERVPPATVLSREEALATLAGRFLQSHGPATIKDFSWWSGLTLGDARKAVQSIGDTLQQETLENKEYWFMEPAAKLKFKEALYLLPNYDEYVVAYADREMLVNKETTLPREGNPLFSNVIVRKGKIEGTWKRDPSEKAPAAVPLVSGTLSPAYRKQLDKATEQYRKFMKA